MRDALKNPVLQNYYGSEITPADQLIDNSSKSRILPYKASDLKGKGKAKAKPVEEEEQPEFTQQEIEQAERARLTGQTAARQKVLPTVQRQPEEGEAGEAPTPQAQGQAEGEQAPEPTRTPQPQAQQQAQLSEQGQSPEPQAQPQPTTKPQPKPAADGEGEGDDLGQMLGTKPLEEEAVTATTEAGGEAGEGILAGLIGGLSEVPILGALVDIGGIIGSIFGAKALMKQPKPTIPIVTGGSYEPNL
jgi:hypothetical protein